jgi:hypothetical protein
MATPPRKATPARAATTSSGPSGGADVPVVGGRELCPCGSGRRYKACHGRAAARHADRLVTRPFAGLAGECDLVALREIVPAGTAELALTGPGAGPDAGRQVTLATVLPMAWPAMVRADGRVFVGLQVPGGSGDLSRDVAAMVERALAASPGSALSAAGLPGPGPRLQDLIDPQAPLDVVVHAGFDFWLEGVDEAAHDADVTASMERANAAVVPTARLVSVPAAYWGGLPERNTLRWVLPEDEEPLLDALARLKARDGLGLGPGTRFVGSFRAHGLLVPVWDLPGGMRADDVEDAAADLRGRLDDALLAGPLTDAERHARAGLQTRQLTLR